MTPSVLFAVAAVAALRSPRAEQQQVVERELDHRRADANRTFASPPTTAARAPAPRRWHLRRFR